jgi:hypothetical protein
MTIPVAWTQDAAMPLNGLSPRRSNPRLGFELMKISEAVPDRCRMRHRIGASLTLKRRRAADFAARSASFGQKTRQNA